MWTINFPGNSRISELRPISGQTPHFIKFFPENFIFIIKRNYIMGRIEKLKRELIEEANKRILGEQNSKPLKQEERINKFNSLIQQADKIYRELKKGIDLNELDFDYPFSNEHTFLKKINGEEDYNTPLMDVLKKAQSLYSDESLNKKRKYVGDPSEIKKNINIVNQKISEIKNFTSQLQKGLDAYQNQRGQEILKKYTDHGFEKVEGINLPDGTYVTNPDGTDQSKLGPNSIRDLYIYDNDNNWTGYLFTPTSGGIPRSGPSPEVTVKNKKVTSSEGVIYFKNQ
jgi:hypothetical protein